MKSSGNTILVTGGGSGIGRALAERFHAAGNTVIIAGRRKDALDAVVAENPGMQARTFDIADAGSIAGFAERLIADFPDLNVVLHNAGIMVPEKLTEGAPLSTAEETIAINLLGPIRLTEALLPHLIARDDAVLMTVSSGLAFVPLAITPTYSATKAAIHSWSQSLRLQLKDVGVEVIEIAPPYVQTELMGPQQAVDPRAMPLKDFIDEVMEILAGDAVDEVIVTPCKFLRNAEAEGRYPAALQAVNSLH